MVSPKDVVYKLLRSFPTLPKRRKVNATAGERQAILAGDLLCTDCGHRTALNTLEPLQMTQCSSCESMLFVPLRIGNFCLFEPLGGGGMGSVYKAWHTDCGNNYFAVKVLPRLNSNDPACINALLTELLTAKQLSGHPSVVRWVSGGFEDGEYFCAMEYLRGIRLDELIETYGKLPIKIVLEIAMHVLAAEEHIYSRGYLYRDLKPENIVLVKDQGRVVLIDFGLCLPLSKAEHPDDEFISGSPYYIPPERLWGTGESAASEIYSLGMIMYYGMTGKTFYDAKEVETLAQRHVSELRVSVSTRMKGFDSEIVDLLARMLLRDRDQRFQSFPEVGRVIYDLHKKHS